MKILILVQKVLGAALPLVWVGITVYGYCIIFSEGSIDLVLTSLLILLNILVGIIVFKTSSVLYKSSEKGGGLLNEND